MSKKNQGIKRAQCLEYNGAEKEVGSVRTQKRRELGIEIAWGYASRKQPSDEE
jgi:hypothetical protein